MSSFTALFFLRLFSLEPTLTERIPGLQQHWVIVGGGGLLLSELRDWPNYTQAKELSVSAITIIAQFTFWLIPGASAMGEYLVSVQGRSCAQPCQHGIYSHLTGRCARSLWADSADGRSPGWNVMQAAGPGWGRVEDKETDGPTGLKFPGVREEREGGTQIRVDIIFWAKGWNTDSYCCKGAKPA